MHRQASDQMNGMLEDSKAQIEQLELDNADLKRIIKEQENKITAQDKHQAQLEKKFVEWETAFQKELKQHKDKIAMYRSQVEGDQKALTDKIEIQEREIAELKLELTSKEVEMQANDLQYEDLEGEDLENNVDEEEAGLESGFNRTVNASQIEGNESCMPLVESELNELSGADGMMGASGERDYAELDGAADDIFETDNCKCLVFHI